MKQEENLTANRVLCEYRDLASTYDRDWSAYTEATVAQALTGLSPSPGEHILDVGCGTGVLLARLNRQQPNLHLTGIDPVAEMLEVARSRLPESVSLYEGGAGALPFAARTFDAVVSSSVFHYVDQPRAALREMHRVLRPGGRIVLTDWCRDYTSIRLLGYYLRLTGQPFHSIYSSRELYELLHQGEFADISVKRYKIDWLWGMMLATAVS